ncbi:MAG: hypothetical protein ABW321_03595, partial [Polyangiales bacterium]
MRVFDASVLVTMLVLGAASACDLQQDSVAPSCYGESASAGRGTTPTPMTQPAANGGGITPSRPNPGVMPSGSSAGRASSAPTAPPEPPAPTGGSASATSQPPASSGGAPAEGCDLTGQWLMTVHKTTDGLGNLQY